MQKGKNGLDYAQNYDLVTKWMLEVFKEQTLEVLGIKTGRIKEVFSYEPAEIIVKLERLDIIIRDELDGYYHLEEQRNLAIDDMYRFASYHFQVARQVKQNITDIILTSGNVYKGQKVIETKINFPWVKNLGRDFITGKHYYHDIDLYRAKIKFDLPHSFALYNHQTYRTIAIFN